MTETHGPDLDLDDDDLDLLERLWRDEGAAAFAFDPAKHPHDQHGRWASLPAVAPDLSAWANERAGPWLDALDRPAVVALADYKLDTFYPINKMLRLPGWPESDPEGKRIYGSRAKVRGDYAADLAHLDAALSAATVDRPVVVHRGFSAAATDILAAFDAGALTPGTEITDPAYVSASLDPAAGKSFKGGFAKKGPGAVMHIALSPGDKAAHLGVDLVRRHAEVRGHDPARDVSAHKEVEHELLLPRNTTFRVLRTYTQGGLRHIDCAVARQDPPPPAAFFHPDQPRDDHGRFGPGDGPGEAGMERLFQQFHAALPFEERKAINDYVGPYYQQINYALRKHPDDLSKADWHTRNIIETLDAALSKFPAHAPQTSWRGVKVSSERRWAAMRTGFEAALSTGDPVKLDGFTSASLSRNFAGRWATRAVLVIKSPRGAYLGDGDSPDEREVLHRHGERFKVTAIRDEEYPTAAGTTTRPTYYLEAVADAPPPIPRTTGVAEYAAPHPATRLPRPARGYAAFGHGFGD